MPAHHRAARLQGHPLDRHLCRRRRHHAPPGKKEQAAGQLQSCPINQLTGYDGYRSQEINHRYNRFGQIKLFLCVLYHISN